MTMKLYEYIDEFIAQNCNALGDEFCRADVAKWAADEGLDFDVSGALTSHREHPDKRVFGTERVRLGPNSFYRVDENGKGVSFNALRRMHEQQAEENVNRWGNEYRCRMVNLARRDKRAARILEQAKAEMKAIATVLHTRLVGLEEDEDD